MDDPVTRDGQSQQSELDQNGSAEDNDPRLQGERNPYRKVVMISPSLLSKDDFKALAEELSTALKVRDGTAPVVTFVTFSDQNEMIQSENIDEFLSTPGLDDEPASVQVVGTTPQLAVAISISNAAPTSIVVSGQEMLFVRGAAAVLEDFFKARPYVRRAEAIVSSRFGGAIIIGSTLAVMVLTADNVRWGYYIAVFVGWIFLVLSYQSWCQDQNSVGSRIIFNSGSRRLKVNATTVIGLLSLFGVVLQILQQVFDFKIPLFKE